MSDIIVYTRPGCAPCMMVKRHLDDNNIPYTAKDVEADPKAEAELADLGFMKTPITVVKGQEPIIGYDYPRLSALTK